MLDGKSASGKKLRGTEEIPTRLQALQMYTLGSAWLAHDEANRGSLEVGKWADIAVLTDDYLTVPLDQIGRIHSNLTMVGGKIVHRD
jgi:predicted amidohydrolase YtcJ